MNRHPGSLACQNQRPIVALAALLMSVTLAGTANASVSNYYYFPTNSSTTPTNQPAWPTDAQWTAVPGLQTATATSSNPENDYKGSVSSPAVQWYSNATYLYFRTQLRYTAQIIPAYNTPFGNDVFFLMVDKASTTQKIDYSFSWDVQNEQSISRHGLELNRPIADYSNTTVWSAVQFDDADLNNGQKLIPDFDSLSGSFVSTGTDGYIRATQFVTGSTVDNTYIDLAVSWGYLAAATSLTTADLSTMQIALANIHSGNDHTAFKEGAITILGTTPGSTLDTGFSPLIPEPTALVLLGLAGSLVFTRRRS